jgi:hypothetical protein
VDERDPNYVCFVCGGDIVPIGVTEKGRTTFRCENGCQKSLLIECTICHNPRSAWADDGDICTGCAIRSMFGEVNFTPEQQTGINKWKVEIPLPNARSRRPESC